MSLGRVALVALACVSFWAEAAAAEPIKTLLVDGQNNHAWRKTSPLLKKYLEDTKLFTVDVATTKTDKMPDPDFKPDFSKYQVVVSNYNGAPWPQETREAFVNFVKNGGGFVVVHAANNSFGDWKEYNEMIGLGGWGQRDEKSGPYVYFDKEGKVVRDTKPGSGGHHGAQHPFLLIVRDPEHPVTKGMPSNWMHGNDELYDQLRGPAENMHVLATAFAAPDKGGSGRDEPMILTVDYGKGRVFHTPMGHGVDSLECVGFMVTYQRGAEWAATGKVTQALPSDFPTADKVSARKSGG